MPATTKTPLGAETVNSKWYLDIDTTPTAGTSTWIPVLGITNFQPNTDQPNLDDDSDFDSNGFMSQAKTATAWSATCTVARKVTAADATVYDAGQEFLRTSSIGKIGTASVVHVRFYEMSPSGPRVEAYSGFATVSWEEQGGDMKALDTVQVNLVGRGQLAIISHPDTGSAIPTISSVTLPAGQTTLHTAGSDSVIIRGNRFTGTTAVTFGGTAASSFVVGSDGLITATAPAKTAGSQPIVVTNGAGASASFAETYA